MRRRLGCSIVFASALFMAACSECDTPAAAPRTTVIIGVPWPGAPADEGERAIAVPLERALADVPGVSRMTSISVEGAVELALEAEDGEAALAAIRTALARAELPADAGTPSVDVVRADPIRFEVSPTLAREPGPGRDYGVPRSRVLVEVDPRTLSMHGLELVDVAAALARPTDPSAGTLHVRGGEVLVRPRARSGGVSELAEREVRPGVRVSDIATVSIGAGEGRWAQTSEERVTLSAIRVAADGIVLLRWGSIPRVRGNVAVLLFRGDASEDAAERSLRPLLVAAAGVRGVRAAVALHGDTVWGAPPWSGADEILVVADSADTARAAVLAAERAAESLPGVRVAGFAPGDRWIRVTVRAESAETLERTSARLDRWLAERPDVSATWRGEPEPEPAIDVRLRPEAAALGVDAADVARAIRAATSGNVVSTMQQGSERLDVVLRFEREGESDLASLDHLEVTSSTGARIPLSSVAELRTGSRRASMRVDQQLATERYARTTTADLDGALAAEVSLPVGVTVSIDVAP